MARRPAENDPDVIPDGFADDAAAQHGFVHLPFEAGSADPQELEYADLPGVSFDPEQDWREAQSHAAGRMQGEFAPQDQGEFAPESEEATDG